MNSEIFIEEGITDEVMTELNSASDFTDWLCVMTDLSPFVLQRGDINVNVPPGTGDSRWAGARSYRLFRILPDEMCGHAVLI